MFKQVFRTEVLDSEEVEINKNVYECKIEKVTNLLCTRSSFSHMYVKILKTFNK